jgi:hypothetical protein
MQGPGVIAFVPNTAKPWSLRGLADVVSFFEERNYLVSGVTRNAAGVATGGCTVKLFNAATDLLTQTATSDASGNYSFAVDKTQVWYVVAYLAGSPDVAGTTVNTLVGA